MLTLTLASFSLRAEAEARATPAVSIGMRWGQPMGSVTPAGGPICMEGAGGVVEGPGRRAGAPGSQK